ncbi:MAG TPA: hypothetical protein VE715_02680 [Blastocatellia bacterium]|nr:hypothetical protein [Blastocatellia bacterium]
MDFTYKKAEELYKIGLSEEIKNIRRLILDPIIGLKDAEIEERKAELDILESLTLEKWIEGIRYIIENDLQPNWECRENKDNKYDHVPPPIRFTANRFRHDMFDALRGR